MMNEHLCIYCKRWVSSEITKKSNEGRIKRKCPLRRKTISIDSVGCKYFDPADYFFCEKNGHAIAYVACLNRRRNPEKLITFESCERCKQFELKISPIIKNYWIDKIRIITPREGHKLKRIIKTTKEYKSKRKIKRRERYKPKRIIKRRK